jgi:hypothetical protein
MTKQKILRMCLKMTEFVKIIDALSKWLSEP